MFRVGKFLFDICFHTPTLSCLIFKMQAFFLNRHFKLFNVVSICLSIFYWLLSILVSSYILKKYKQMLKKKKNCLEVLDWC